VFASKGFVQAVETQYRSGTGEIDEHEDATPCPAAFVGSDAR
jgi:hypothetical protein